MVPNRLVGVVGVAEFDHVGAEHLLVDLQVLEASSEGVRAGAVHREHDLLTDVDAGEPRGRAVDVDQVVDLLLDERRYPRLTRRLPGALFDVGAQLASRLLDKRAVTHTRSYAHLHGDHPLRCRSRSVDQPCTSQSKATARFSSLLLPRRTCISGG